MRDESEGAESDGEAALAGSEGGEAEEVAAAELRGEAADDRDAGFAGGDARGFRGEHRDQVERGDEGGDLREDDGKRHVAEHLAGHAFDEDDGEEHGDGGERGGDDGHRDLGGAAHDGGDGIVALLATAENTFEHDDRVVHEVADAEGEAAEGDDVERDARHIHRRKRREDRDGDAERNDERLRDVAEKQIQHCDRDEAAEDGVFLHLVDRVFDEDGLVGEELDGGAGRELEAEKIGEAAVVEDVLRLVARGELGGERELGGRLLFLLGGVGGSASGEFGGVGAGLRSVAT